MSVVPSTMLPLGTIAPDFRLLDTVSSSTVSLDELKSGTATVIMFICNHCPFVQHVREELVKCALDYEPKDVSFVAISANDAVQFPNDGPTKMAEISAEHHYPFPYLYDEIQEVAKAYQAACTPDFFIFDSEMKCVYRGQLDGSRPGNHVPITGDDLRNALDCLLAGKPISEDQKPSQGCNIKWREE